MFLFYIEYLRLPFPADSNSVMTTVMLDLSIVIPAKDEEKILAELTSRISNTIDKLGFSCRRTFVKILPIRRGG